MPWVAMQLTQYLHIADPVCLWKLVSHLSPGCVQAEEGYASPHFFLLDTFSSPLPKG